MQKVVGSSPIIRSHESPGDRAFSLLSDGRVLLSGNRQRRTTAHYCPIKRPVVRLPVQRSQALTPFRRLRVDAEGEAGVLVAELVGRVADVVAAGAAEARVRPAEAVERHPADRRDAGLFELRV